MHSVERRVHITRHSIQAVGSRTLIVALIVVVWLLLENTCSNAYTSLLSVLKIAVTALTRAWVELWILNIPTWKLRSTQRVRSRDRRQSFTRYHLVSDDLPLIRYARQFWKTTCTPVFIWLSAVDILYIPRVLQVRARPDVSLVILRDEPLLYNKEYRMTKNIRKI